jgi:hypothetical protein
MHAVDRPTDRDPPRWGFSRLPTRAEAWAVIRVVFERMGIEGRRALRELSIQDP